MTYFGPWVQHKPELSRLGKILERIGYVHKIPRFSIGLPFISSWIIELQHQFEVLTKGVGLDLDLNPNCRPCAQVLR